MSNKENNRFMVILMIGFFAFLTLCWIALEALKHYIDPIIERYEDIIFPIVGSMIVLAFVVPMTIDGIQTLIKRRKKN